MIVAPVISRYIRNPEVVLREEDIDGALLFNPDTNRIKVLNHTGLFIWKLCDGSREIPAIVKAIGESFEMAKTGSTSNSHISKKRYGKPGT